jgi:hypothetical protein
MALTVSTNPTGFQGSSPSAMSVLQGTAAGIQTPSGPTVQGVASPNPQLTVAPTASQILLTPQVLGANTNTPATGSGSTTDGTATSSTGNGANLSSYDQGIDTTNAEINDLTPTYNNDLASIANSYQTTMNNLNQQNALTKQSYNTAKTQDARGYVTTKNAINTNTGNTISSVDRLLGARGAGGESAGDYAALLAGKQGTGQRAQAGLTFGQNEQGLDTNYNNTENAYTMDTRNADLQRTQAVNAAQAKFDTNKANLLTALATLTNERTAAAGGTGVAASQPDVEQAKALMAAAAALGNPQPVAARAPVTYTPPALASYTANPSTVALATRPGASAATDSVAPYAFLLNNRQNANALAG